MVTYRNAPPLPREILSPNDKPLMTEADIVAGKAGFQKADLMDYGSIYGMGSYFGEDYTASALFALATDVREAWAQSEYGRAFHGLAAEQQIKLTGDMQRQLQGIDLSRPTVRGSQATAIAIVQARTRIAAALMTVKLPAGWIPARSLTPELAGRTADFIIYSALTTVARWPGQSVSWTENWPFEPLVGNTPSLNVFHWTWISYTFTFFAFGVVLWVLLHFFEIGWPQLDAVYQHGPAWARSQAFYDKTRFWQWMRLPGDVVFALGALILAWDVLRKLRQRSGDPRMPSGSGARLEP